MLEKNKVICIDKSDLSNLVMNKILNKILPNSIEIITCNDYLSILDFIKLNFKQIKFIVCDHNLDKMDSLQFINWMELNNIDIPIVLLTSYKNSDILKEYEKTSCVKTILNKPVNKKVLEKKIYSAVL